MPGHVYNVRRSVVKPEERQRPAVTSRQLSAIPVAGDLWPTGFVPSIWDQGAEGSCTAHGNARAYETQRRTQKLTPMNPPSRALLYDLERELEGTPLSDDAGAVVTSGPTVLQASGCCDESMFQYTPDNLDTAPNATALAEAALHKVGSWARVPLAVEAIVAELAQGYGVVFGFDVYDSFESDATAASGIVTVPQPGEKLLGGHCMCLTGWDVTQPAGGHSHGNSFLGWLEDRLEGSVLVPEDGWFWADNSWGASWGLAGRCKFPFAMFTKGYAFDPVVITSVAG